MTDDPTAGPPLRDITALNAHRQALLSRRTLLTASGAAATLGLLSSFEAVSAAPVSDINKSKTRSTFYTPEKTANARENVTRFGWAKNRRDAAVADADEFLEKYGGLDGIWNVVTTQKNGGRTLPRGIWVSWYHEVGSPVSGIEIYDHGYYPWKADPGNDPWKLIDPVSGYKFPTNDFVAYRESGLDEHHEFDPDLADDTLLVNELYPEKGETWGVDDGTGWVDEDGNTFTFVAYYNHWKVWYEEITSMLRAFRDAYLFSGDQRYARAGTVLLDRIADVYPDLDISVWTNEDYIFNSHGWSGQGKAVGCIWEGRLVKAWIGAYDAFFPAQEGDDALVTFLNEKANQYDLGNKSSVGHIRENIEANLVRQVLPAVENAQIRGNFGYHQSTLAMSAVVQDDPEGYTADALEFLFRSGEYVSEDDGTYWGNHYITGGDVLARVVDIVDRDGHNNESVGYNDGALYSIRNIADILDGYDAYTGADLYENVKVERMHDGRIPLIMLDQYMPHIGDTGSTGNPGIELNQSTVIDAFERYSDPIYAQTAYLLNSNSTAGIRGDIFDADPAGLADEIQAIIDAEGPLDLTSQNLAGYGFAVLRDGENHTIGSPGIRYDTSRLFVDASTAVDDSFDEAIQLEANVEGEWWAFEFEVDEADKYEVEIEALFVSSYGIYELYVNDALVDTVDFMADGSGRETLTYLLELPEGTSELRWENVGKNEDSSNYKMALYYLSLFDEEAREQQELLDEFGNAKRAFWLTYGRNYTSHNNLDTLNLGVFAKELNLSPDLGYPTHTGTWPSRMNWQTNTISHNTVVVDERGHERQWVSTPRHFDDNDHVKLFDVEAPDVYPQTEEYRRTTAMIRVDEADSYAVDFFRVSGGDDHRFSFHGAEGTVSTTGLDLVAQDGGTYVGKDVPKPEGGEDTTYNQAVGNGFNYLDNVERDDDPAEQFSVDWDVVDTWDVRDDDAEDVQLRLTMVGDLDEVALADGETPQQPGNPERLRYLLARRTGENLDSTFTSIIEPYEGLRFVESISEAEAIAEDGVNEASAVKIELQSGRTDYVICAFDDQTSYTVDETFEFRGFMGVYSERDGEPEYAYVNDGGLLALVDERPLIQQSRSHYRGVIEEFTRELTHNNELVVKVTSGPHNDHDIKDAIGDWIYVETDGERNGAYEITDVTEHNGNRVTLAIGEKTTVQGFIDPASPGDGYRYLVSEGADVRIPVSETWSP